MNFVWSKTRPISYPEPSIAVRNYWKVNFSRARPLCFTNQWISRAWVANQSARKLIFTGLVYTNHKCQSFQTGNERQLQIGNIEDFINCSICLLFIQTRECMTSVHASTEYFCVQFLNWISCWLADEVTVYVYWSLLLGWFYVFLVCVYESSFFSSVSWES